MLIMSILHLDILDVIFYSVIACACCGPSYKNKTCLLIFSIFILVMNSAGLITITSFGASMSSYAGGTCITGKTCQNMTSTSSLCINGGMCTREGKLAGMSRRLEE